MNASETISQWHRTVSEAALAFESRWTMLALRRLDPEMSEALHDQKNLFVEACVTGRPSDIAEHGAAMVRGYAAVVQALEDADMPDDSFLLGIDPVTGMKVAVGEKRAAAKRVAELHGQDVILLTPDEVATLFASTEALKSIVAIKRQFPGAEVIDVRYPNQQS